MKNFISVKEMNEKVNEMFNGAILKYESNEHKGTYVTAGSKFIAVGTNDGDIKTFKTWEDAAAYANSLDSEVKVGIRRARHSKYTVLATVNCEVAEQEETVALNTEVADEIIRNLYDSVADAYGSTLADGEEYNIKSFADFLYSYAHCGEVPGIDDYIEAIGVDYEWEDYLRVEEMFSNRINEKFIEYLNEDNAAIKEEEKEVEEPVAEPKVIETPGMKENFNAWTSKFIDNENLSQVISDLQTCYYKYNGYKEANNFEEIIDALNYENAKKLADRWGMELPVEDNEYLQDLWARLSIQELAAGTGRFVSNIK